MRIIWSEEAVADLGRVYDFLARANPRAGESLIDKLTTAPDRLLDHPRLGIRHEAMAPAEVRRLIVGSYEMRYQIQDNDIAILRIFHCKEDRH